jgi:hypothetical protein
MSVPTNRKLSVPVELCTASRKERQLSPEVAAKQVVAAETEAPKSNSRNPSPNKRTSSGEFRKFSGEKIK